MPLTRLDSIDRLILAELQADGKMTNVELAKRELQNQEHDCQHPHDSLL